MYIIDKLNVCVCGESHSPVFELAFKTWSVITLKSKGYKVSLYELFINDKSDLLQGT